MKNILLLFAFLTILHGQEPSLANTDDVAAAQAAAEATASADATSKANAAQASAIQRANHTGTQLLSTISDAGTAAAAATGDFDAAGSAAAAQSAAEATAAADTTAKVAAEAALRISGDAASVATAAADATAKVGAEAVARSTAITAAVSGMLTAEDFANLPTTEPYDAGELWNNAGVISITDGFHPSTVSGYLATFDTTIPARIKNGSDNIAAVGDTVKRWNSDNPGVYFSQATAAKQPQLLARGIRSLDAGDLMTSTGIGTTEGRTVIVLYSDVPSDGSVPLLFDANSANSLLLQVQNNLGTTTETFNYDANTANRTRIFFTAGYANISVARKAADKAGLYSARSAAFSNNLAYAGTRASTALNLFSKGSTLGQNASANVTIVALLVYDGYLADADALKVANWVSRKYATVTPKRVVDLYDIWGQSNAAGRAITTGVTDFNGIDPANALMVLGSSYSGLAFGTTQNLGGDSTASQYGAESELLRLATADGSAAAACKYAVSGSGLYNDWLPTSGTYYTASRERTRSAEAGLVSTGFQVRRKGLIWIQGEKDALESQSSSYSTRLQTLVANYRSTYGANIPVAVVRIKASAVSYPDIVAVQAAQASAVAAMGNAILIDTSSDVDYPQLDGVHFAGLAFKNIAAEAYAFFSTRP